ncbi:conserved exported hypothetical protein [Candidatus Sulfopaludibacter sp. SbA3]|nr:conserved exported hypothetical protein [Candidatus Sulfopaludibacter sp. SbA3]
MTTFRLGLVFVAALPLAAQFSNLATDDAGSRVWFSSALQLRGTQQNQFPKIFIANASGNVQLIAQAAASDSYSLLTNPEVSGDGTVLAYTAEYYCPGHVACRATDYSQGVVTTANGPLILPGTFHLSRNGRYLLRENYTYSAPTDQFEVIDLTTLQKRDVLVGIFQAITAGGRQVTSAGAVLAYADGLWLFAPDGSAQLVPTFNVPIPSTSPFSSFAARAAVDDSGTHIVYQAATAGCALILTSASASAQPTALVQSGQPCTMQTLSADGTTVLFTSPANFDGSNAAGLPECWVVDTTSQVIRPVGHDVAGIAEATLSGNGSVVWAVTLAGRLIRMDRNTGATQEIISQTTAVDQNTLGFPLVAAPGALVHLTGRGLAAQSASSTLPLATTVGGVQLLADGQPLPLLSVAPADIVFQVPWEMQGTHTLTLAQHQSPFEEALSATLQIQPAVPAFWSTADGSPAIVHGDFHGLVTPGDPAHPDEILHLYLTGLGAATPAVATGQAAPQSTLSMMTGPVYVFWAGDLPINFPFKAEVLFAGLAPGTVGLEQIDVQVPHEAPTQLGVSVQGSSGGGTAATFPVAP